MKTTGDEKDKSFFNARQRRHITIATLIVNIFLVIAGFIVEPPGVIDSSVLTAVGELGAFAALITGFETNFGFNNKHKQNNYEE